MTDVCTCRTIAISAWDPVQLGRDPRRPIHATYTASEVKVLTETVSKVAYALGRKDAAEEIAVAIADHRREFKTGSAIDTELFVAQEIALGTGSQVAGATSDATSGVPGHQEVSEAVRSPQEPCGHPACPCVQMHSHPEGNTP